MTNDIKHIERKKYCIPFGAVNESMVTPYLAVLALIGLVQADADGGHPTFVPLLLLSSSAAATALHEGKVLRNDSTFKVRLELILVLL